MNIIHTEYIIHTVYITSFIMSYPHCLFNTFTFPLQFVMD